MYAGELEGAPWSHELRELPVYQHVGRIKWNTKSSPLGSSLTPNAPYFIRQFSRFFWGGQ